MSTCRFCQGQEGSMVKYSIRHYAHAACGLQAQGAAFFENLTDWQCTQFPYLAAKKAGFEKVLEQRCARYHATQARAVRRHVLSSRH